MFPVSSEEGSGGQRQPQGSPSSKIEKKYINNNLKYQRRKEISCENENPNRKEIKQETIKNIKQKRNHSRTFQKTNTEKKSIKNTSTNPDRNEIS